MVMLKVDAKAVTVIYGVLPPYWDNLFWLSLAIIWAYYVDALIEPALN